MPGLCPSPSLCIPRLAGAALSLTGLHPPHAAEKPRLPVHPGTKLTVIGWVRRLWTMPQPHTPASQH